MEVTTIPPLRHQRVSVVIPALNEAENLPHVLPRIPAWIDEVILVDGHSTDDTVAVARALLPSVRIVTQQGRGKGAALRSGFAAATGDIIVMLDADGSTDPGEIPAYVGALLCGADFAKGSRFLQGGGTADMPHYRRLGNMAFVYTVRALFGGRYSDLCYGYNAFWARVVPLLQLDGDGFEIETMMNVRALRAGLKVAEVPSFEAPRVYGEGRLRTIPDGWRVLKTIYKEHRKPLLRPALAAPRATAPATLQRDAVVETQVASPTLLPVASPVASAPVPLPLARREEALVAVEGD
jgi:glycosyltransferase involved in cell wall biosynthesis